MLAVIILDITNDSTLQLLTLVMGAIERTQLSQQRGSQAKARGPGWLGWEDVGQVRHLGANVKEALTLWVVQVWCLFQFSTPSLPCPAPSACTDLGDSSTSLRLREMNSLLIR